MISVLLAGASLASVPVNGTQARRHTSPTIKGASSANAPALAALARIGVDTLKVRLSIVSSDNSFYRIRVKAGTLTIDGSSQVALIHGAYRYLSSVGALHVSAEGDRRRNIPYGNGFDSGIVQSPFKLRSFLNTCTFGYTSPWWNWDQWGHEIDQMATRGVDTPLAMEGQEIIWQRLWLDEGLTENQVADSFSAAPYLPWQRMGNVAGVRAPLSHHWIEQKRQLQRQILERMRSLGMRPILPAFSGYVPKAFADMHPEARIYKMRAWEGFPGTYWLDPADPLFAKLAKQFIDLYRAEYGNGSYFLVDAFNEMVPPIADDGSDAQKGRYGDATANQSGNVVVEVAQAIRDARLASYGDRLFKSLVSAEPSAVWVMQGWMFGADKAFWTPSAIKSFLSKVPDDRMLILDIGNDRYPGIWADTNGFAGKQWAYGYVHNYGGSNPVYGDLEFYRQDLVKALSDKRSGNLSGFGMFPEGLRTNNVAYAYPYDLAWGEIGSDRQARPVEAWLTDYLRSRYGAVDQNTLSGWIDIIQGVYSVKYWTPRWWGEQAGAYLFFKLPSDHGSQFPSSPSDSGVLRAGIDKLVGGAAKFKGERLYTYDLVDFARHYGATMIDNLIKKALIAYARGDVAAGDRARTSVEKLAESLDDLSGNQQETLGTWLSDAKRSGGTASEKAAFVEQAKAIVTIWGGAGHLSDYASRAWQGLIAGYYLPRWQMYLTDSRQAAVEHRKQDSIAAQVKIQLWQNAWLKDGNMWPRRRPTQPILVIKQMLKVVDESRG